MNIAILGAGRIAQIFTKAISGADGATCYAVAARDVDRARKFAEEFGYQKYYGSYEEMLSDPEVELVYVATPHSHHYEHMKLCIEHKKPILCEKSFTVNAAQAKEIIELAAKNNVFVAEAIWTRYMPSRQMINDIVNSGVIGKVSTITANLDYAITDKERMVKPELAGGSLLDVGVYCLNFAVMHMGKDIDRIESTVVMTDAGVDAQESMTVVYKDGRMAVLTSGMYARSDRKGIFYGEKGYIIVENINNPQSISVFDDEDNLIKKYDVPEQINGYEYELIECMDCVKKGLLEAKSMPLSETVYIMELMDGLRADWGLKYPME